jgi:hypothetical protein
MKLTGKDGILRIYDSLEYLHGAVGGPYAGVTVDIVTFDGASTWANITSDVDTEDLSSSSNILPTNSAHLYIGSTSKFALVEFIKAAAGDYAVGSGALIGKYYNGSNFNTALPGLADGSLSGGNCFGKEGKISFEIPRDWALGANAYSANLDSDKYYIDLQTTTSSSTDFDADVLCPADTQYIDVQFAAMDFNGPIGRPLTEEQLVLNRGRMSTTGHYVKSSDDVLYQPLKISFSCLIDDTHVRDYIEKALACGNPTVSTWGALGITSKGTTKNDGVNFNPIFIDTSKKAVNIQMLWTNSAAIGMAYYETYFPPETLTIQEGEEGVILNAAGGCYGVIERISGFGVRY